MAKSLDAEITAFVNELEELREKNPIEDVGKVMEEMFDAQADAEGKTWDGQSAKYTQALTALNNATSAVKAAKDDMAKTPDAVTKANAALQAVLAALA